MAILIVFWSSQAAAGGTDPDYPTSPDAAILVTRDIDHFWTAFDAAAAVSTEAEKVEIWQERYIDVGTPGLHAFLETGRIKNAESLAMRIAEHEDFYANLRPYFEGIPAQTRSIMEAFERFEEIYPDALFPPVYFVIGEFRSGGFPADVGLMIGMEIVGRYQDEPAAGIDPRIWSVMRPLKDLHALVAHESIHFNQHYSFPEERTLLMKVLDEGVAEYLGVKTSGQTIYETSWSYYRVHESELKEQFKQDLNATDNRGWLYGLTKDERPRDLGYVIGAEIARNYYERATDKTQAIHDMLHISNPMEFLNKSGFYAN